MPAESGAGTVVSGTAVSGLVTGLVIVSSSLGFVSESCGVAGVFGIGVDVLTRFGFFVGFGFTTV